MNLPNVNARVAVIGAGTMGIGIAQVAAGAGHPVWLFDIDAAAARQALDALGQRLRQRVESGKADADATEALLGRIQPVESLDQLADSALVIEAVAENWRSNRACFVSWKRCVPRRTVRQQHFIAVDYRHRRCAAPSTAPGRFALLQPGTGDEAGRDRQRVGHQRRNRCRTAGADPAMGQTKRAVPFHARLYR